MRFEVDAEVLSTALRRAQRVLPVLTVLAHHSWVWLVVGETTVTVRTSSVLKDYTITVPAVVTVGGGQVALDAEQISQVAAAAADGALDIEVTDHVVRIATLSSEHTLPRCDAWLLEDPEVPIEQEISSQIFLDAIDVVRPAMGLSIVSQAYGQINVTGNVMAATDGAGVHSVRLSIDVPDLSIPEFAVAEVRDFLTLAGDTFRLGVEETRTTYATHDMLLEVHRSREAFPNVAQTVHAAKIRNDVILRTDRDALAGAVRRMLVTSSLRDPGVLLEQDGEHVRLSSGRLGHGSSARVLATWDGEASPVRVSGGRLVEALENYPGAEVEIRLNGSGDTRQAAVLLVSQDEATHMVMAQMRAESA